MGNFLIGAMLGGTVGVFTMAMCISAKRADENIENIIDKMKPEMIKNMEPIFDDTTKLIDNIVDDLKIIVTQRKIAQKHLKNAHQMLVQIAKQIKIEGEK